MHIFFYNTECSFRIWHTTYSYFILLSFTLCFIQILWISQVNFKLFHFGKWHYELDPFVHYIFWWLYFVYKKTFKNVNCIYILNIFLFLICFIWTVLTFWKISTICYLQNNRNISWFQSYTLFCCLFSPILHWLVIV